MQNIFSIIFILLFSSVTGFSQIRLDVFGGFSPGTTPTTAGLIVNRHTPLEEFVFNMVKVEPQYFAGAKSHIGLKGPFFIELGLTYTKHSSTYTLAYTMVNHDRALSFQSVNAAEHNLMLPVNAGVMVGVFEFNTGLRAIGTFSEKSGLHELNGFTSKASRLHYGWQGGMGLYILKSRIGIEFQGSFSRVGSRMFIHDQNLELMNIPGQWIMMIQQSF